MDKIPNILTIEEDEIVETALHIFDRLRKEAIQHAQQNARDFFEQGDEVQCHRWLQVAEMIEDGIWIKVKR